MLILFSLQSGSFTPIFDRQFEMQHEFILISIF